MHCNVDGQDQISKILKDVLGGEKAKIKKQKNNTNKKTTNKNQKQLRTC
jgi:hypothetical protein